MKVTINGKEYECQEIKIKTEAGEIVVNNDIDKKKTGYERVSIGMGYYAVNPWGDVDTMSETNYTIDYDYYDNVNYYSSKEIAKNNARADRLIRQLRRFSVENRKSKPDWINRANHKYRIAYNHLESMIRAGRNFELESFGTIYFDSKELAEQAIKEFKNELIWYFTEYKDSL